MSEVLREVRLHGELGRRFGRVHRFAIRTPGEAVRALSATVPGFGRFLVEHSRPGFHVFVGAASAPLQRLHEPFGRNEVVRIVPVVAGAGGGGNPLRTVIYGVMLYYSGGALGAAIGGSAGATVATVSAQIATAMVVGGVIQALSPQPRSSEAKAAENGTNFAFDGPENLAQEGVAIPLVFGRVITGSVVISSALVVEEVAIPPPPPAPSPPPPPALPPWEPGSGTENPGAGDADADSPGDAGVGDSGGVSV